MVVVYRSPRVENLYLFVDREEGMVRVPEELLTRFGEPEEALSLVLTPERRLARVQARTVLDAIELNGFYLQLPPAPDEWPDRLAESAGPNQHG
jgi:uncharacterized protein YcgL (UPF0745 family)